MTVQSRSWLLTAIFAAIGGGVLTAAFVYLPAGRWMICLAAMVVVFCVVLYLNPAYFFRRLGAFCILSGLFGAGLSFAVSARSVPTDGAIINAMIEKSVDDWIFGVAVVAGLVILTLDQAKSIFAAYHNRGKALGLSVVPIDGTDRLDRRGDNWKAKLTFSVTNHESTDIDLVNARTGVQRDKFTIQVQEGGVLFSGTTVTARSKTKFFIEGTMNRRFWHRSFVQRRVVIEDSRNRQYGPFEIRFRAER